MPNNGKIVEWNELEYKLSGDVSASGSGGVLSYGYSGSASTVWAYNVVLINAGIDLTVSSSFDGTSGSWQVSYDGPGAPFGGYIVSGSSYASTSIAARLRNVKIYSILSGALYRIIWDAVDIYVNGSFDITLPSSGGDETSNGVGPNYIPIVGVPITVNGSCTAGIDAPAWVYDECDNENVPDDQVWDATATIVAGTRFKETTGGWQSLPIHLDIRNTPCAGCPFSLNPSGLISGSDTSSVTLNPYTKGSIKKELHAREEGNVVVRVRCVDIDGNELLFNDYFSQMGDYTLLCDGSDSLGAVNDVYKNTNKSESGGGSITVIPNLPKNIEKYGDDYACLVYRNDFPSVTGAGSRSWNIDATSGSSSVTPQLLPGSEPFLGKIQVPAHPMEDFLDYPTHCPVNVGKSKAESISYEQYMVTALDMGLHPPPGFNDPEQCPEGTVRIGVSVYNTLPLLPTGTSKDEGVSWNSLATVDGVSNYQYHVNALLRYHATWGHPLWHYFHFKDNFSDIDFLDYWGPIRSQYAQNAALPTEEKTFTRNDIIGSCYEDSGHTPFMDEAIGHRFLGISRPKSYTPTIPANCTTNSESADRWHFGVYDEETETWDGTGSVGSSISLTGDTTIVTFDALSFDSFPYMYPLICDKIEIANSFTNVDSFTVELIGADGTAILLADTFGTYEIPRGTQEKYAGSWGLEHSPIGSIDDLGVDDNANGISDVIFGNPLFCSSSCLLPSSSYWRIRYTIVRTAPGTATVPHIKFIKTNEVPKVVWETGHVQTLLYPDGNAIRLGNWTFYSPGVGLLNPPAVSPNLKTTIVDAICTANLIFNAKPMDDNLFPILESLVDEFEGPASLAVMDKFGVAWLWENGNHEVSPSYKWCLVNTMAETPPLTSFPNKSWTNVSGEMIQNGSYKHEVIDHTQEKRILIHPSNAMHQFNPSDVKITSSVGEITIPGWSLSSHKQQVDNLETPNFPIKVGTTTYAETTPWHGWFAVLNQIVAGRIHLTNDYNNSFIFATITTEESIDIIKFNNAGTYERQVMIEVEGTEGAAQSALQIHTGSLFTVYQFENDTKIVKTTNLGRTKEDVTMITNLRKPAIAIDNNTGTIYVAGWRSGVWKLYRKLAEGDTFTLCGDITSTSETYAGLEISPDTSGKLIFMVQDSGDVRQFISTSMGDSWNEL